MTSARLVLAAACIGLLASALTAADPWTAHPIGSTAAPYGFLEHLPPGYLPAKPGAAAITTRHPLVFALHGKGELGDSAQSLAKAAAHGPLRLFADRHPLAKRIDAQGAIIVAPQALTVDGWWRTEKLIATLDVVLQRHPAIDPDRIYITGLSMGGGGTWALATAIPERIAAIVPICPAAKPGTTSVLRGLPIWAAHAIGDTVVPWETNTRGWFDAILADAGVNPVQGLMVGYVHDDHPRTALLAGGVWSWQEGVMPFTSKAAREATLLVTVYPDKSHNSWTRTYTNPALWEWLFHQRRSTR